MFDHITLRVADLALTSSALQALLDQVEIEQTTSTPSLSVWGNFALTQTDDEHPIARRVRIGFTAPTTAHVDRFAQVGVDLGFAADDSAEARPDHLAAYSTAFVTDAAGNSFGAVHRDSEVEASTAFFVTIGAAAGLTVRRRTRDRTTFSVGAADGSFLVVAGEPTRNVHIAFSGEDDDVRRFHADGTAAGYGSNGEPGERARYHAGYYAAYLLDPDGNNIEVVNHHRSLSQTSHARPQGRQRRK